MICTHFPRTVYTDRERTLEQAGLSKNAMVFVEEVLVE